MLVCPDFSHSLKQKLLSLCIVKFGNLLVCAAFHFLSFCCWCLKNSFVISCLRAFSQCVCVMLCVFLWCAFCLFVCFTKRIYASGFPKANCCHQGSRLVIIYDLKSAEGVTCAVECTNIVPALKSLCSVCVSVYMTDKWFYASQSKHIPHK